jgi:serine/threonine protein kinase
MTPERWQQVGAIFDQAVAAPPSEREAIIRASSAPADVQDEVRALLEAHDGAGFLEPAAPFSEGDQIGTYRIVRLLGRGGMGLVYLAEDTRLHRQVALKALPPHLFKDERMRSRLRKEAQAAAALSHPSIATVFALEEIGDQLLIATEYLEGRTLRDEMEQGPLPPEQAIATSLEIARALAAAHGRGVAHRDLKPENIVRLTNGAVKILDFGLAKFDPTIHEGRTGTLTESGIMAGTPRYMAPEQILGQPTGVRTDQFAFGVLMYELILGRHPFGEGSLPSIVARALAGEPDGPSGFDAMTDAVWNVVRRCLQKDPPDRFASTNDLVAALERSASARTKTEPAELRRDRLSTSEAPVPHAPQAPTPLAPLSPLAPLASSSPDALWWWRFHQLTAALVYWAMVWPAWHVHNWLGRAGVVVFFATLASVIVSGNLRMHLSFTARALPSELTHQRARVRRWIRLGDYGFTAAMLLIGLAIADAHNAWGALFLSMGLGAAIVFLVVEPSTERAAFRPPSL